MIGYGYWGKNIARVLATSPGFELSAVCDRKAQCLNQAARNHPGVQLLDDLEKIGPEVDVVAILTEAKSHFTLAQRFLRQKKHVLVTKPFTSSAAEAADLFQIAADNGVTVFADHTYVFHPAIQAMKRLLPRIGKPHFVHSQRLNLGLFQPDVNVIQDLTPHDVSIICYLLDTKITQARTFAFRTAGLPQEDTGHSTFVTESGVPGLIAVSWLSPFKVRQLDLIGSAGMLHFDDAASSEKLRLYDKGIEMGEDTQFNTGEPYCSRISYRTGDLYSPAIPNVETLAVEMVEFRKAIENETVRQSYNHLTLRVMQSLEALNHYDESFGG